MISGISAALSGFDAAAAQLDVSANNLANQGSTQSIDQRGATVNAPYVPQQVVQSSLPGGGVATSLRAVSPAAVARTDPTDPAADARGIVQAPNVDPAQQLISANLAGYDARANLKSIQVQSDMMRRVLDLIS